MWETFQGLSCSKHWRTFLVWSHSSARSGLAGRTLDSQLENPCALGPFPCSLRAPIHVAQLRNMHLRLIGDFRSECVLEFTLLCDPERNKAVEKTDGQTLVKYLCLWRRTSLRAVQGRPASFWQSLKKLHSERKSYTLTDSECLKTTEQQCCKKKNLY